MRFKSNHSVRASRWPQWLVVAVFLLAAGFTVFKAVQMGHAVIYWQAHRDEPIRGWMSVGYVAHSYRVPPHVLNLALGLPYTPPDRRPLRDIANAQHRSLDDLREILQNAIIQARQAKAPSPPPPPDPSPDQARSP